MQTGVVHFQIVGADVAGYRRRMGPRQSALIGFRTKQCP
jgi:hypothetical protein